MKMKDDQRVASWIADVKGVVFQLSQIGVIVLEDDTILSLINGLPSLLLQDVAKKGGPGALALLRDADAGCLHLMCLHLNLDLSWHAAIDVWTASVTHKPYALDPDFDL